MLSCRHSNLPSKHSSWEPTGGELKHYYRGGFIACLRTKAISLISSRLTNPDWSGIFSSCHVFTGGPFRAFCFLFVSTQLCQILQYVIKPTLVFSKLFVMLRSVSIIYYRSVDYVKILFCA